MKGFFGIICARGVADPLLQIPEILALELLDNRIIHLGLEKSRNQHGEWCVTVVVFCHVHRVSLPLLVLLGVSHKSMKDVKSRVLLAEEPRNLLVASDLDAVNHVPGLNLRQLLGSFDLLQSQKAALPGGCLQMRRPTFML